MLPQLTADNWQATSETIQGYAKVLGKVRRALTPQQKHWWHVSLRTMATGFTTTPMWVGDVSAHSTSSGQAEIMLDLTNHHTIIQASNGKRWQQPLDGIPATTLLEGCEQVLTKLGAKLEIDHDYFRDYVNHSAYDPQAATQLWQVFSQVDWLLKSLRHSFREESSPVQLWPHHFDLALLWFSGNLVDGQDPANEEWADEQMNFGFVPGDETIAEPYFYVTAYPRPDGFAKSSLPGKAYWSTEGFYGAVLKYADADSAETILAFLQAVHAAGKSLMLPTD